jgi:hypothetical protein
MNTKNVREVYLPDGTDTGIRYMEYGMVNLVGTEEVCLECLHGKEVNGKPRCFRSETTEGEEVGTPQKRYCEVWEPK